MPAPSILFIGGTGIISSAASALAQEQGLSVTILNRGTTSNRGARSRIPAEGIEVLTADITDPRSMDAALGSREFDVVIDMVAMTPADVERDIARFEGATGQYIFISSASAYQKPVAHLPITESTPLKNPFWQYSRDKIACEDVLAAAYRDRDFPVTVVRPSHTYDVQSIPLFGGWTEIDRMRRGDEVVIPGDGTSLWTLTHTDDFATAFVGLFANPLALGDTFQITSDFVYTWNEIYGIMAAAAGAELRPRHATSQAIEWAIPGSNGAHTGDRSHSVVFDNTKVKSLVPGYTATIPFSRAARSIVDWYDADEGRRVVDAGLNAAFDALVADSRRTEEALSHPPKATGA